MVLALNVSVYFCKLLPLHMNGNLPVGIGMHVFAMICDLIHPLLVSFVQPRLCEWPGSSDTGVKLTPLWCTDAVQCVACAPGHAHIRVRPRVGLQ
eukprot:UN2587